MIKTRMSEVRYTTSDPKKMLNKYLVNNLYRTWTEDFLDEDTGQVIPIERNEILFDKGTIVDQDILAKIRFFIQEGSIKEVEVSNQKRLSYEVKNDYLYPYTAQVQVKDKKYKFLFYAKSVENAVLILKDYVELNFNGSFNIIMVKEFDTCIIIIDTLKTKKFNVDMAYLNDEITMSEYVEAKADEEKQHLDDDEKKIEMKFYKIVSRIVYCDKENNEEERMYTFVVKSITAERANMLINVYLKKCQEEECQKATEKGNVYEIRDIQSSIEESSIIPIRCFIPREFSEVYL